MHMKPLGTNKTELHLNDGAIVFFSYQTPVAAQMANGGFIVTRKNYSVTTSKHITQWLEGVNAADVDQSVLDGLIV